MLEAASQGGCPPEILALIPWYPDGPLSESERGAVEAHAASCRACRDEVHALLGEIDPPAGLEISSAARALVRALDRLDGQPPARPVRAPASAPRPATAARRRVSPQRLALAASLALAVGLGVVATLTLPRLLGGAGYTTAAASGKEPAAGPVIEMIPRDDARAAELRTALRRIDGELVGGPAGTLGRYQVRLPAGADASAAAAMLRAEEGGIATYAERIHP